MKNIVKINDEILEVLDGKMITLVEPLMYCTLEDWYGYDLETEELEDIPNYMEVIDGYIYFKSGIPLPVGKPKYTCWPTLGEDEFDVCLTGYIDVVISNP